MWHILCVTNVYVQRLQVTWLHIPADRFPEHTLTVLGEFFALWLAFFPHVFICVRTGRLTKSFVSINAGVLDGSIVALLGVFLVFFVDSIGTVSVGQSVVC